ncbi:hypothetical protein KIH39_08400 [Telmatocola sphagniphila]|uniref:Uncharacterized protein n=1 Tax=Telmatocola sphagniphila TaxID=1123043 RepID=A0A8E6B8N4_9BACT|nr:hypothetical protein [Telmatocola sphagniphila]QVL33912.1 hypothetical protein KIH39_08400 [Telmatocola sphagniphila]
MSARTKLKSVDYTSLMFKITREHLTNNNLVEVTRMARIHNKTVGDNWEVYTESFLNEVEDKTRLTWDRQFYEEVNNNIRYLDLDISDQTGERFAVVEVKSGSIEDPTQIQDHIQLAIDSTSQIYVLVTPDGTCSNFANDQAVMQELQSTDVRQLIENGTVVFDNPSGQVTVVVESPENLPALFEGLCDGKTAEEVTRDIREREKLCEATEKTEGEAAEKAEREAAEKTEREAAEKTEREAAEKTEREAAEKTEREAAEKAEREAAEKAEREAAEKAEREAAEKAEREAAEKAEREAAEKTEREAAEKTEREAAEKTEREAAEKAEREAAEKAEREAAEKAEREAAEKAEREAAEKAEREAAEKTEREAAEKAEREAAEKAEREAAEKAEHEAAEKAERDQTASEEGRDLGVDFNLEEPAKESIGSEMHEGGITETGFGSDFHGWFGHEGDHW